MLTMTPARRALAAPLLAFGQDMGAVIVAEGIETPAELETLIGLDIQYGQGCHLAQPCALSLPRPHIASLVAAA